MAGPMARTSAGNLPPPPSPSKTASPQPAAQSSNRQESHRIYLQFFAPRSPGRAVDQSRGHPSSTLTAASSTSRAGMGPVFHRHDSHEIHPPKYPMTAPGAPYPFSSSSSSESSASYSFSSSLSSVPNSFHGAMTGSAGNGGNNSSHHPPSGHRSRGNATPSFHSRHDDGHPHSRSQSNHRNHSVIHGANHNPTPNPTPNRTDKPKFAGYPPTTTTSAAVRLTDRARARDVTALLRGKFGLPPLSDRSRSRGREGGDGDGGEIDALVLVGTMERPPRGYLRFEHEEFLEERSRLEAFRTYRAHAQRKRHVLMQQQQQQSQQSDRNESADGGASSDARNSLQNQDDARMEYQTQHRQLHEFQWSDPSLTETIRASNLQRQPLPISNSAATIRASGAQGALDQSSSSLASHGGLSGGSLVFDAGASGRSGSHDILQRNISREQSSPIGVRESGNSGSGSGSAIGLDLSSSRGSSVFGGSGSRSASSWGAMVGQTVNDISNSADETASSPTAVEKGKITTWSSLTKLTTLVSELSDSEHDMSSTPQKEGPPADASAAVAAVSDAPFTVRIPGEPHARQTTVTNNSRTLPNQRSVRPIPLDYDYDSEPIHIVRTVRPEEHPLRVRDEMFTRLIEMRLKAEMEMGLRLGDIDDADDDDTDNNKPTKPKNSRRNLPATQPTFRWYFQPCCALGECGTTARSPKIQNIPSYVDLEGYCTGTDEEMEEEDERESDDGDGARPKSGISSQEVMPVLSSRMRQLAKERRRISLLQDLPDPSFLVSGYLLKQSSKDPNVWRRVFCVLSADRMWIVGRMKPLVSTSERNSGSGYATEEFLSSLRVGRHSSIKLHRSLLLMGGSGDDHDPNPTTSSNCNNPVVSPLNRRLPNAFRIWTANGECHTFRAYTLASFRVWTRSLMEKITLKHGDDLMELADLIAEGENLARSRRMEELAVTPFMDKIVNATGALDSLNTTGIMMHVTRFGMLVSEYRELCRHTNDAVRPNHGMVLNVRTKVGSTLRPIATRQIPGGNVGYKNTPLAAIQLSRDDERVGMIAAVWEEARVVASRSAQLLHALAALQQGTTVQNNSHGCLASNTDVDILDLMNGLVNEQKEVQSILGQRWNDFSSVPQTHPHTKNQFSGATCNESTNERKNILALPPTHLFDSMVEKFQNVSALTSV